MHIHTCKQCIFQSYNSSTISAMHFDENRFTCQRENKEKGLWVSNFTRLLVVFKWHPGSEGITVTLHIICADLATDSVLLYAVLLWTSHVLCADMAMWGCHRVGAVLQSWPHLQKLHALWHRPGEGEDPYHHYCEYWLLQHARILWMEFCQRLYLSSHSAVICLILFAFANSTLGYQLVQKLRLPLLRTQGYEGLSLLSLE